MPVWISCLRTFSEALAGPIVQTIFVLRIFINLHDSVRESKKEAEDWSNGMVEQWSDGVSEDWF